MADARTPPAWSVLILIPLVFVGFLSVGMLWYALAAHLPGALSGNERYIQLLSFYPIELLGILGPVLLLARVLKADMRATFPLAPIEPWRLACIVGATVGLALLITYFQAWFAHWTHWHYPAEIEKLIHAQRPIDWLIFVTGVALIPALCEEAVTRGFLQSALVPRLGLWPGIAITAIVFALFHLTPAGLPTYLVLGLWLSWIRHRTGSLVGNVAAHTTNNLLAILQANFVSEGFWGPNAVWLLPLGAVLFVGLAWVTLRTSSQPS